MRPADEDIVRVSGCHGHTVRIEAETGLIVRRPVRAVILHIHGYAVIDDGLKALVALQSRRRTHGEVASPWRYRSPGCEVTRFKPIVEGREWQGGGCRCGCGSRCQSDERRGRCGRLLAARRLTGRQRAPRGGSGRIRFILQVQRIQGRILHGELKLDGLTKERAERLLTHNLDVKLVDASQTLATPQFRSRRIQNAEIDPAVAGIEVEQHPSGIEHHRRREQLAYLTIRLARHIAVARQLHQAQLPIKGRFPLMSPTIATIVQIEFII